MRVLLVQTLWRKVDPPVYPLGLAYLAAALKNDHEVICVDENMLPEGALLDTAVKLQPDVIGLSLRNSDSLAYQDIIKGENLTGFSALKHIFKLSRILKQRLPKTPLIIGGNAFTIFAQRVMEAAPDLDFGVVGEGDLTLPLLLKNLSQPETVPGIIYRREGQLLATGEGPRLPFSQVPTPDHNLMDVRPYIAVPEPDTIGIQTKRGCSLHCAYCVYPFLTGAAIRQRDPKTIVDEIASLVNRFGMKQFQFADSVFNHPPKHAQAICDEMIRRGIKVKWTAWFDLQTLDENLARAAFQAGCRVFELSPDGYTDRTLKALGKGIKRGDIIRACRMLERIPGAIVQLNFLNNSPGESVFDTLRLLSFFLRIKLFHRGKVFVRAWNFIRLMPNTPLYRLALEQGCIKPDQELLPMDPTDLIKVYYRPHPNSLVEKTYNGFLKLSQLKGRVMNPSK
jgi:anaerobic magnesium-protoporphyrin IX monomethyl ester cyclase